MDQNTTQIDPTALNLSRSIRYAEGGSYDNTSGDNGTSAGAYQWNNGKIPLKKGEIPANFKSGAQELGLDPNDFSQTNQDHVAYAQIKKDLDSGLSQSQIAAKWNSGLTHGWENHKGSVTINGKTVSYDTPAYVEKVKKYYESLSNGTAPADQSLNSDKSNSQGYITKADIPNLPTPPQDSADKSPYAPGNVISDAKKGDYMGALKSGIGDLGKWTGVTQLGEGLGGELAKGVEKTVGFLGGQDNSKYLQKTDDVGNILQGGAKVAGTVGTLAGAGAGLLGFLGRGAGALVSPTIIDSLPGGLSKEAFLNLGKTEQLNILGDMAKTATKAGMVGDNAEIAKAIQYLLPPEKASLIAKLIKGTWNTAKNLALAKIIESAVGDKVGGYIKKVL